MMAGCGEEWVQVSHEPPALLDPGRINEIACDLSNPQSQRPQIISYCGGRTKTRVLRRLHRARSSACRASPHTNLGRLVLDRSTRRSRTPSLVLSTDVRDMRANHSLQRNEGLVNTVKSRHGLAESPDQGWALTMMHRLFFPFCDLVVLFAEDFGGLREISVCLEAWCSLSSNSTLPHCVKPVVIVVFSRIDSVESQLQEESFMAFRRDLDFHEHFFDVALHCVDDFVHGLPGLLQAARDRRQREHLLFTTPHLAWFFGRAVHHVAADVRAPFDILATSRAMRPPPADLQDALGQFMQLATRRGLPHRSAMTLVASRILLDAYDPREHEFAPQQVFGRFYSSSVLQALENTYLPTLVARPASRRGVASALCQQVLQILSQLFEKLVNESANSTTIRADTLRDHAPSAGWQAQDLHRMCFFCLSLSPDHVFACGHQICDSCVPRLGQRLDDAEYHYQLSCRLCRTDCVLDVFLKPPTAGVRVISLDGGGIRGLVEHGIIERLQQRLGDECDVRDCFDLAIGTSAGGLTVLGLFAERWPLSRCRRVFEETARNVFGAPSTYSLLPYIRYAFKGNMYSSQYSKTVLQQDFGSSRYLFGPPRDGTSRTKVGVTLTRADGLTGSGPSLCVATNYSGDGLASSRCPGYTPSARYQHLRPRDVEHEMFTWQAGLATSAAPLYDRTIPVVQEVADTRRYFEPAYVPNLKTCLDGGLESINPTEIAVSEALRLWPRAKVDTIVSIGTGRSETSPARCSFKWLPHSLACLAGWVSTRLVDALDPEKIHDNMRLRFQESVTYHRLNVDFRSLPRMDDVNCIPLIPMAVSHGLDAQRLDAAVMSLLSSSFFFELDDTPMYNVARSDYVCVGSVRLRTYGHGALVRVRQLWPSGAAFRLSGTRERFHFPLTWAEMCPRCTRFNKRIQFQVRDLDQQVQLHLVQRTATDSTLWCNPHLVSGFPGNMRRFVEQQMLDHPRSRDKLLSGCMCRAT